MCDDVSVICWLKNLRYNLEYYDPYDVQIFGLNNAPDGMDTAEEPVYVNLWNCASVKIRKAEDIELKYGDICRVSVEFCDQTENFESLPPILAQVQFELPEDVMLWKEQLRENYCEEEQDILENQEVLKTLQISNKDDTKQATGNFPTTDQDFEVQYRNNLSIHQYRTSKTTDFDFGRKLPSFTHDFEAKGCIKILLPNDREYRKLNKNEIIKYHNRNFYKAEEKNMKMTILRPNVILKGARLLNKREVELRDANNLTYILVFDSSKEAKSFIESDKLSSYVESDSKSTITKTLLRLLGKRSSREVLEKKGIYQNEPIFGNTLRNIFLLDHGVPRFISKIMELIERPENITSLGLYRTSGNLATIQKIRFEVDKGRLDILNDFAKDVDVLTGSLKLFFRELKEPLISCDACDSLLSLTKADQNYSKKERDKIRSLISCLPDANLETLRVLVKHLLEVVKYKDQNKMDTYNLAVCWGPTIIFATDSSFNAGNKDLVTQSTEATRLFDTLLIFYINYPEELDFGRKKQDRLDSNKNMIRQDSKDSIQSSDSNNSRGNKKTGSNQSLDIDEVLKKSTELIEINLTCEGLYKKAGSIEKVNKIVKKMAKKKILEMDKYKCDPYELTDSLKKYIREIPEPLTTREIVDQVTKICDNSHCLEQNTRQKVISIVGESPKKDMFIFLLKHLITVTEQEPLHKVPKSEIISIWTDVLNNQHRIIESNEKFSTFLKLLLDVFDDKKADISVTSKGMTNGLLNDLRNHQKDKDRTSRYDNVPDEFFDFSKEATILEEKTDQLEHHTKL